MSPQEREDAALEELLAGSAQIEHGLIEAYGPHPDQVIEWYGPSTPGGTPLVFVHGGFFRPAIDRSHARLTAATLATTLDLPVALVEYRRVPGDPTPGVADIQAISDRLGSVTWVGHSAGGTLSLLRAFDPNRPNAATVALAPIVDVGRGLAERLGDGALENWLGPEVAVQPSAYACFNPARVAANVPERLDGVQCVHGADDLTVPATQSSESGIPHVVIPAAHHFDIIDPASPAWPAVVATIQALVPPTR